MPFIRERYSSTESETSDEEWTIIIKRKKRQKRYPRARVANYVTTIVEKYTEFEFKSHFRMSRATFECLLTAINEKLIRKVKGCQTIPARHQLMIALWKMVTTDSYRSVCDRCNVGRATAVRAVRRVTKALFHLAPKVIQWPTGDRAGIIMRCFEEAKAIPILKSMHFVDTKGA